ncbi:MAG: hypothetical protein V4651_10875 [Bacteroidota bacterium]
MGWQSANDFSNYIQQCEQLHEQQQEVSFMILQGEDLVGRIGLYYMNMQSKNDSIRSLKIQKEKASSYILQFPIPFQNTKH